MPVTREHEAPIDLFTLPEMLLGLLSVAHLPTDPDAKVEYLSERCTQIQPVEFYADQVTNITYPGGDKLVVIIEIQRSVDEGKELSWPLYVADARQRSGGLPVALIVWCPDDKVAAWARQPIGLGPSGEIRPFVVSPADFPVITDPDEWNGDLPLAIMAALIRQNHERFTEILAATVKLIDTAEQERAETYYETLARVLDDSARIILEGIMTTMTLNFQSDFTRKNIEKGRVEGRIEGREEGRAEGREEGRAEGEVHALLIVLNARGFKPDAETFKRIMTCTDSDLLSTWLAHAAKAETIGEVFA